MARGGDIERCQFVKIGDKPMTKEKRQETDGIQFGKWHENL